MDIKRVHVYTVNMYMYVNVYILILFHHIDLGLGFHLKRFLSDNGISRLV